MAALCGIDPISYVRLSGLELTLANAVIQQAHRLRGEEAMRLAEAIGIHVGNRVGETLARALTP